MCPRLKWTTQIWHHVAMGVLEHFVVHSAQCTCYGVGLLHRAQPNSKWRVVGHWAQNREFVRRTKWRGGSVLCGGAGQERAKNWGWYSVQCCAVVFSQRPGNYGWMVDGQAVVRILPGSPSLDLQRYHTFCLRKIGK